MPCLSNMQDSSGASSDSEIQLTPDLSVPVGGNFLDWARRESKESSTALEHFAVENCKIEECFNSCSSEENEEFRSKRRKVSVDSEAFQDLDLGSVMPDGDTLPDFTARDSYLLGPPQPACGIVRHNTAVGLNEMRVTHCGEIESMLRLMCTIFNVDTGAVTLLTGDIIYITGACGALAPGICPSRWGFCGWSFLNSMHELLVCEDLSSDARFSQNFFVVEPNFNLMFYAAAPLVAANGHRMGTLCILDQQPRAFDATRASTLANLAEMLVRQLEQNWAVENITRPGSPFNHQIQRPARCYKKGFLYVDTSESEWRILHMNPEASEQLGQTWEASYAELKQQPKAVAAVSEEELAKAGGGNGVEEIGGDGQTGNELKPWTGVPFSSVFCADLCRAQAALKASVEREEYGFTLRNVPRAGNDSLCFDLDFRLASGDNLDADQPFFVGKPSFLKEAPEFGRCHFIVAVRPAGSGGDALEGGLGCGVVPKSEAFPGLVMGPLIGSGSYGKVYRGMYNGEQVAVKVTDNEADVLRGPDGLPLEASLTKNLHHVGMMSTLDCAIVDAPRRSTSNREPARQCWMLMEYCNAGALVDAVVKGWFRNNRLSTQSTTNIRAVAITAFEISSAMSFLHEHKIVHGDLSGGNVMLTSHPSNLHGFCAKVADFGLARSTDLADRLEKHPYGTVTHMPPEVLLKGEMTPAADVYAFGVLLWEMLTGTRAWAGLMHAQIICQVGLMKRQLAVPEGIPAVLADILASCTAAEKEDRPQFVDVSKKLTLFLQETRGYDFAVPSAVPVRRAAGAKPAGRSTI